MSQIERFEHLIAWQKARELTREIYNVTREGSWARDFGYELRSQAEEVGRIAGGLRRSMKRNGLANKTQDRRMRNE